ncbi:MAG: cell division protein FtsL [Turicibacter sp.]|nr:cell division protein FtsL [Turicibacter sp.]
MSPLRRQVEQQQPLKRRTITTTKRNQSKKTGLYSLQGLAGMVAIGVFLLLVGQLYLDAQINEIHYQVERKKLEINQKEVANEELYSKISELSTYSRAMEIAKANGLATFENTITIGE